MIDYDDSVSIHESDFSSSTSAQAGLLYESHPEESVALNADSDYKQLDEYEENGEEQYENAHEIYSLSHYNACDSLSLIDTEVFVLFTSLRSDLFSSFDTQKIFQLLACKRVAWFELDLNKEIIRGLDLANLELLDMLPQIDRTVLPQIIIDGVSVGGYFALYELETEGLLDQILTRKLCGSCLQARKTEDTCSCGSLFSYCLTEQFTERVIKHDPNEVTETIYKKFFDKYSSSAELN